MDRTKRLLIMLYGFNFDGTLVQSFSASPLPGVPEALARLPSDAKTFVATNQAGPVFRAVTGEARYPSAGEVACTIHAALTDLSFVPDLVLVCCAAPETRRGAVWRRAVDRVRQQLAADLHRRFGAVETRVLADSLCRKPHPGMLLRAAAALGVAPGDFIYIGDRDVDRAAADAAGARFLSADSWRPLPHAIEGAHDEPIRS